MESFKTIRLWELGFNILMLTISGNFAVSIKAYRFRKYPKLYQRLPMVLLHWWTCTRICKFCCLNTWMNSTLIFPRNIWFKDLIAHILRWMYTDLMQIIHTLVRLLTTGTMVSDWYLIKLLVRYCKQVIMKWDSSMVMEWKLTKIRVKFKLVFIARAKSMDSFIKKLIICKSSWNIRKAILKVSILKWTEKR